MTSHDSPRVRRDLLVEAQRLTLDIDRTEDELERFRDLDVPAFRAWFAGHFAAERAVVRRLEDELAALTERHNGIVALAQMHELSLEHAYRLIESETRTYARANAATRARIDEERARRRAHTAAELDHEFHARTRAAANVDSHVSGEALDLEAVKTMYRRLARRLHPDAGPDRAGDDQRWRRRYWRLLQSARDRGDAAALADLDAVTKVRQMDLKECTLDEARRARHWLARENDELSTERDRAAATVAWGFGTAAADTVEGRVRAELHHDAEALRADIRALREEHEYLSLLGRAAPDPAGFAGPRTAGEGRRRARFTRRPVTTVQQLSFFD